MTKRSKRKAAETAREAIRTILHTSNKKRRSSVHKRITVHINDANSIVPEQDGVVMVAGPKLRRSSQLSIQPAPKQSESNDRIQNTFSAPANDPFYDQLKQLPDKLLVQLPCGMIRDAAVHLKNVNYNALAGFIIFRTDLHPVIFLIHLHLP
ncbi:unnamed protein product [Cercopithifilaria johnstoni]|uniref:Uncharacterized protein n=1 Tax=Cercopithifilaria johnstoni TaxID=2874296 RepID=A0A8J2M2E1_9BILA|nr:unnamed protein product [Cercopithifilaria johnstoni]